MSNKYVLQCDHDDPVVDDFVKVVKLYNRSYAILYNRQPDGGNRITHNNISFESYDKFVEHIENTSGGYDGTFGYYGKVAS